jgi:hypothetical protein
LAGLTLVSAYLMSGSDVRRRNLSRRLKTDFAWQIARIANLSRKLGYKLRAEKRNLTEEQAYIQLGHGASLLKAVLQHLSPEFTGLYPYL